MLNNKHPFPNSDSQPRSQYPENQCHDSSDCSDEDLSQLDVRKINQENVRLRSYVLDLELKERDYITKILELQTCIAKVNLQVSLNQEKKSRSSIQCNLSKGVPLVKLTEQEKQNLEKRKKKQSSSQRPPQNKRQSNEKIKQKQGKIESQKENDEKTQNEIKKFHSVITKTYSQLFGLTTLKQIWKKHKEILADWLKSDPAAKK